MTVFNYVTSLRAQERLTKYFRLSSSDVVLVNQFNSIANFVLVISISFHYCEKDVESLFVLDKLILVQIIIQCDTNLMTTYVKRGLLLKTK